MLNVGEHIGKRYEILKEVGSGRTSIIYQGRDTKTGEIVAVKSIRREHLTANPDGTMRFMREGSVLKQIEHPHIIRVYDTLEQVEGSYIVMEYLGGGSLDNKILQEHPLSFGYGLSIIGKIASALDYLHGHRIYHRDINPLNVMFTEADEPRLMDFNVAHMGHMSPMTLKSALLGTVAYMSPEMLTGSKASVATEVWALGMMLYKTLAGELPMQPKTARDVLAVTKTPVAPITDYRSDTPPEVVTLITKMLAIEPAKRPSSMQNVENELHRILADL